jgi:hypothetical protein
MRISKLLLSLPVYAAVRLAAQQPAEQGARELYYAAMVKKDPPPPVHRAAVASGVARPAGGAMASSIIPVSTAAMHLGLRYNLVLVDADTGRTQAASPDRIFRAGECFAIEVDSNRAGFLYVLARQSSGTWQPLLPSKDPEMATESNQVEPEIKVRVPLKHCFEVQDPPGVDTLFVVLSREPRDSFELYENMKGPETQPRPAQARPAASVQIADASIGDAAVMRMREQFGTRDIAIKKVSQPLTKTEPVGSVYVVSSSNNPASNVAATIEIRHR